MKLKRTLCCGVILTVGLIGLSRQAQGNDWPQWLGPQRDAVWRESGIVSSFSAAGPEVLWRVPVGGGYSGPAVVDAKVYLTDRQLAKGASNPSDPFSRSSIAGTERILCLRESDGKLLWKHEYASAYTVSYAAGPRTTPSVADGRVFTLGAEGDLFCLDAVTGTVLWSRQFKKDFGIETPLWGFSAHPLIDGNKLICLAGGDGSTVVAFDTRSGKELWRALSAKEPGYAPPMIYSFGGRRELIVWHPESINGLDPETGKVYWTEPFEVRSGLSVPTPRQVGNRLFLTCFYNGSKMMEIGSSGAKTLWQTRKASEKDTEMLHSIISTPYADERNIFGVCSYGQLRCLDPDTGERRWETLQATTPDGKPARWANAFLVKQADQFFIWNEKGDLIIARLDSAGYHEISRAHLLDPTNTAQGRDVVWSHPAFANRRMYARNDSEIICVSLATK